MLTRKCDWRPRGEGAKTTVMEDGRGEGGADEMRVWWEGVLGE